MIARRLAQDPDDADWLRLRARAEMLDRDYGGAVESLRRAADARPEDTSLLGELGTAYALRAEGEGREIDYGAAIDMLWRFLRVRPDSTLALFNRAVVYERMFLYRDAREDWERYLRLDPVGGWAAEARGRKQAIERKMEARDQALKSLASASGYVQAVKEGRAYDPEFYLSAAVTDWLPATATDGGKGEAVTMLARLLREKHSDSWLEDLLRAKRDARYRDATAHLGAAVKYNLADEAEQGLEEARRARRIFREAGVRAGLLRAKYEEVYALYRAMEGKECLALAGELVEEAAHAHYGWIHSEALMESGTCRASTGDEGGARADFERALAEASSTDYKTPELRALGLVTGNATSLGSQLVVWRQIVDRLATYWQAPYPGNRGHQFYSDLSKASSILDYKYSAFVFRRAAAEEISRTPTRVLEAATRGVVASLAEAADLLAEADREFVQASELFGRCRQTKSIELRRFASEVARAEFAIKRDQHGVLAQLEKMLPDGQRFPTFDTELVFHRVQGRAKLMLGDLGGAETAFRRGIECNEQRLASLPERADRSGPLRKSEDAYRGAASISLRRDPKDAFKFWEWYRAADLPGTRRKLDSIGPLPELDAEILLSYLASPTGDFGVWILGRGRVEFRRLAVKGQQLEPVVSRFLRQCADPKSSLRAVWRDARQLYHWLIAPVADRFRPGCVLVIEPDGLMGALPWQALVDPAGTYLGERFPIVISSGLVAYQERSRLRRTTAQSSALVIASPALGDELAKTFPPLEDAAREAQQIAAMFSNARMLTRKEGTLEALESARPGAEIFHFAGHSIATSGEAGLLLAVSGDDEVGGRLLRSSMLLRQDWSSCSLAVLAACSTGTGERNGSVNPESLVRAFLNAGAGRVVASRWNIDTVATAGFMRRFYQSILSGALPSAALREAAETFRKNPATAHPYYWAAFQTYGYQ